jgi:hypothetical protein
LSSEQQFQLGDDNEPAVELNSLSEWPVSGEISGACRAQYRPVAFDSSRLCAETRFAIVLSSTALDL